MRCPNCNLKMTDESYLDYFPFEDFDNDEPVLRRHMKCTSCAIKNHDGEWIIPKKYEITSKQQKAILFIEYYLGQIQEEDILTKNQAIKHISKYLTKAINAKKEKSNSEYYEESDYEYYEQHF